MTKCNIDDLSLKLIKNMTARVLRSNSKEHWPVSTLKANMKKLFDEISEKFDVTTQNNSTDIAQLIVNTASRYGAIEQIPDFLTVNNITNLITARSKDIQINDPIETSSDRIYNAELVRRRTDVNSDFLNSAYGLAKEVQEYVCNVANLNIFDCCFINRGSLGGRIGIVRTNAELNLNIRAYLENLLKKISNYLYLIVRTSPNMRIDNDVKAALRNPRLYNDNNEYTGILELIEPLVNAYLNNIDTDLLRLMYSTINDSTSDESAKNQAKSRLEAYNAKVILNNFDTYLTLLLGKSIQIRDFNVKTGEDKYQIAALTAKVVTTWRTHENINVESEADAVTRLAVNTTPLLRWNTDALIGGQFVHFSDFQHIISKIKDLTFNPITSRIVFNQDFIDNNGELWNSLSDRTRELLYAKSLKQAIAIIRANPRRYLHSIFELLANEDFRDLNRTLYSAFTSDELNKLWSLSRGIFNGDNSLYSLATGDFNTDYYAFITETADSIFNVKYIQYYRDENGIVLTRTLNDLSINNIQRSIEQTINTSNNKRTIKSWEDYYNNFLMNPKYDGEKLESLSFVIPNTDISVRVFANSGDVRITVNNTPVSYGMIYNLVLPFIDNTLKLEILNNVEFENNLIEKFGDRINLCRSLLQFASRVVFNQFVSNLLLRDYSISVKEELIKSIYGRNAPKYNYNLDEINMVHGNDIPTLRNIALAKANYQGVTTSTIVRDGEGNALSQQTLSRLLGSFQSLFELQERLDGSASNHFILLTNPEILEEVYTTKEFYDPSGTSKPATLMSSSELAYQEFVYDFIGGLIQKENAPFGDGHVAFLTSVNSDKPTIGKIKINLNAVVEITNPDTGEVISKPIAQYNSQELQWLINQEFGLFYSKMYDKIVSDWGLIDDFIRLTIPNAPRLANDFINNFVNFNKWFFVNQNQLKQYGDNPANFVKYFVREYNKLNRLNPLAIVDQVHYKSNKGNLATNMVIIALIARFNPQNPIFMGHEDLLEYGVSAPEFWTIKKAELIQSMLKEGFRINTSNIRQPELQYIRNNYRDWVNDSGDMILAKVNVNGDTVNITSVNDILKLGIDDAVAWINSVRDSLEVNPLLEQYNYLEYLFTQEFMNSTVGSFVSHPEKSGSNDVLVQEAAQFNAQHKRNVSFTAAMHAFLLGLLNGVPTDYNIAVVDDIKDYQGTINGIISSIKPFDGAIFVDPFVVILENNSLGGARAGITKKTFVHFKDANLGVAGIIKCAAFGLTNDWIRNSQFMQIMMRKMTDHVWLNLDGSPAVVDVTTSYRGNKIVYNDIYFKRGGRYYKLKEIRSLGNNEYDKVIQEVTLGGNFVGEEFIEHATVNTNYALWEMFGGANSMVMDNNKLKLSNTSVENVVIAMNNVGTVLNEAMETLDDVYLPLKHTDVHYVVTAGAIKQGGANINSNSVYFDDTPYDILKIHMYQAGIQLDKEHHADDSDISLMTLVISACAAKGFTIDVATDLYETLRRATEVGIGDHLEAAKLLFTDGFELSIANFLQVVMRSIIKALGNKISNSNNFAELIARDLMRLAKEGRTINYSKVLLPLSDNTIYAKILSTITSYLTKTGIRLKISGILAVLTPSHNIYKLYGNRKLESFTNPTEELRELLRLQIPVYDSSYLYSPDMLLFMGLRIERVPPGSLVSTIDGEPVAASNLHDGRILLDTELMHLKFEEKAWRNSRNNKPLDRDFNTYEEWEHFVLMREAMHNIYPRLDNESTYDYETRINEMALKRLDNDISNLELNRTYLVTQYVPVDIETDEGVIQTFEELTEKVLIRTPQEYKNLKLRIKDGSVISVVEDIAEGRDLASYNVRFSTTDGKKFQLWDLDSAQDLFELNGLKENWRGTNEQIGLLSDLYFKYTGGDPTIFNNIQEAIPIVERAIRVDLLNDLSNLSPTHVDKVRQLRQFTQTYEDTPQWFNKFAAFANILLDRTTALDARYNGSAINSSNFIEVLQDIVRLLARTNQVRIDGQYYTVNRNSITLQAYEVILPKVFATAFGLNEFDDLNTIASDRDYFIKQYLRNTDTKVQSNLYSIELKRSDGNNIYILNTRFLPTANLRKLSNIMVRTDEDSRMYRQDSNNNDMYEITPDTNIYVDSLGNEVIVSDDIDFYLNNLSYDSVKLSDNLITRPSLVSSIVGSLKKSSDRVARLFGRKISSLGNYALNILALNREYHSINLENYNNFGEDHPIIKQGRAKHTSFLRSLDVIAARIPAQSMQSYMPMKIVAFDNPDINSAYVSTMQILLLGSKFNNIIGTLKNSVNSGKFLRALVTKLLYSGENN